MISLYPDLYPDLVKERDLIDLTIDNPLILPFSETNNIITLHTPYTMLLRISIYPSYSSFMLHSFTELSQKRKHSLPSYTPDSPENHTSRYGPARLGLYSLATLTQHLSLTLHPDPPNTLHRQNVFLSFHHSSQNHIPLTQPLASKHNSASPPLDDSTHLSRPRSSVLRGSRPM